MWLHQMPWLTRSFVLGFAMAVGVSTGVPAQDAQLPPAESWDTKAVPFAVAPTDPSERALTLLVGHHDCGKRLAQSPPTASVSVTEGTREVGVKVEVRVDPDGRPCTRTALLRVKAPLRSALGSRTIIDVSRLQAAPVNRVDPPDFGLEYACGFGSGWPLSHGELMGPGFDVRGRGIPTTLAAPRAIVDEGDMVVLRGPFAESGRVRIEHWRLRGNTWKRRKSDCHLMATSPPNLATASWRLGGVQPDRTAKTVDVKVDEHACASGQPPVGRVVPPAQWYRTGAVYLLFHTFPISPSWAANERIRERRTTARGMAFVDCPGAPPAPYRVKLYRKPKERALYDAAYFPPKLIKEPT